MAEEVRHEIEDNPVFQTAADWLLRLQQPSLTLEETIEWQHWMNADRRHAHAFERLEELWGKCQELEFPSANVTASATDDYDGSEPIASWLAQRASAADRFPVNRPSTRRTRIAWAVAAGVLVASALAAQMFLIDTSRATSFETPVGGNQTVHLADGSVIELAGHSRCDVRLGRHRRAVTLVRGEALFHVTKDPRRPFLVSAGNANVEAVGTEFDIRRTADRVIVAVVEGRVLIQPVAEFLPVSWVNWTHANGQPMTLGAGNQTTVDPGGIESRQAITDPETTLSWRHGRLAFEREPLRDVIADVNRYSTVPIALEDERIGDILITGTVSGSDIEGWIASLQSAFGLHAELHGDRIILKRPEAAR